MKSYIAAAVASAALLGAPAFAGQTTQPAAAQPGITLDGGKAETNRTRAKNRKNPNDIICTREPDIGTRLARKKTCMTRAQLNERRLLDRDDVERSQANRPLIGN